MIQFTLGTQTDSFVPIKITLGAQTDSFHKGAQIGSIRRIQDIFETEISLKNLPYLVSIRFQATSRNVTPSKYCLAICYRTKKNKKTRLTL